MCSAYLKISCRAKSAWRHNFGGLLLAVFITAGGAGLQAQTTSDSVSQKSGSITQSAPDDAESSPVLRVAADPNNLPFSNDRGQGFENRIAQVVAKELGARLEYVWFAQRRGFFRNTLKANRADLVLGVPAGFEMARPTRPLYSSAYVFVTRKDRHLDITSFDDPQLRKLKIGVQLVGDDGSNTPPAHALARRGIIDNVRGYTLYGDYSQPNPPARIMEAVAAGDIDVGVVWGPLAGYFATHEEVPLTIKPVSPLMDGGVLPMAYTICAGVRKGDKAMFEKIDSALEKHSAEIQQILADFQLPQVDVKEVPQLPVEDDDD